jgi:hypothetical protein
VVPDPAKGKCSFGIEQTITGSEEGFYRSHKPRCTIMGDGGNCSSLDRRIPFLQPFQERRQR